VSQRATLSGGSHATPKWQKAVLKGNVEEIMKQKREIHCAEYDRFLLKGMSIFSILTCNALFWKQYGEGCEVAFMTIGSVLTGTKRMVCLEERPGANSPLIEKPPGGDVMKQRRVGNKKKTSSRSSLPGVHKANEATNANWRNVFIQWTTGIVTA
jgi:hypothetical protein